MVLVSGGPDSACAAAGLTSLLGAERLARCASTTAFARRPSATSARRALCERLGSTSSSSARRSPRGNLQAAAREARYAAAERLRAGRGLDWIATGHSRTDQVETVLYRLAVSPGRAACWGLRRGAGA